MGTGDSPAPSLQSPAKSLETGPPARNTDQQIAQLQATIRAGLGGAGAYADLGSAYLQKVRETGDPTYYPKSEKLFDAALAREPASIPAITGLGTLALARHQFRLGLSYGEQARFFQLGALAIERGCFVHGACLVATGVIIGREIGQRTDAPSTRRSDRSTALG